MYVWENVVHTVDREALIGSYLLNIIIYLETHVPYVSSKTTIVQYMLHNN